MISKYLFKKLAVLVQLHAFAVNDQIRWKPGSDNRALFEGMVANAEALSEMLIKKAPESGNEN